MTPMILGNNEEKIVNYCIRVIHQEDNKVEVVVVDKNNGDKVEGVIASDVPTGRYVDCDLTARLYVDFTDALPIQVEDTKRYRTVRLLDIRGNDIMNSTILVVKGDGDQDSTWIPLGMPRGMFIDQVVKLMKGTIPKSLTGAFILHADMCSETLYIEDSTSDIVYMISLDSIKQCTLSDLGGRANV